MEITEKLFAMDTQGKNSYSKEVDTKVRILKVAISLAFCTVVYTHFIAHLLVHCNSDSSEQGKVSELKKTLKAQIFYLWVFADMLWEGLHVVICYIRQTAFIYDCIWFLATFIDKFYQIL